MKDVTIVNPITSTFKYKDQIVSVITGEVDGKFGIFADINEYETEFLKSKRNEIATALENLAAYLKAN